MQNNDTSPFQSEGHSSHIPDLVDQMAWVHSIDLANDQWFENVLAELSPIRLKWNLRVMQPGQLYENECCIS